LAMFAALAVTQSGRSEIENGDATVGLECLQRGWAELDAMGVRLYRKQYLSLLALGHARIGQQQRALGILDEALAGGDSEDERVWDAELLRTRGELLASSGDQHAAADAERSLLMALEIAREQQALLFELRAALSLARHWQAHQPRKAHALLSSVYAAPSEGLDTADRVDARRLIAELASAG
jgi:predicted ATPase